MKPFGVGELVCFHCCNAVSVSRVLHANCYPFNRTSLRQNDTMQTELTTPPPHVHAHACTHTHRPVLEHKVCMLSDHSLKPLHNNCVAVQCLQGPFNSFQMLWLIGNDKAYIYEHDRKRIRNLVFMIMNHPRFFTWRD